MNSAKSNLIARFKNFNMNSIGLNFTAGFKNFNTNFKDIIKVTLIKEIENIRKLFTLFIIIINFSKA